MDTLIAIYQQPEVTWLVYLIIANVVTGIIASLRCGDFRLTKLADFLWKRVIPLLVGYGVAVFLASVQPNISLLKDGAFTACVAVMLGYVLNNLRDWGIPIPDLLAGKGPPNPASPAPP